MSLDLTGISNENEYYSHHYLAAIFEGDLKEVFAQWQDMEDGYREAIKAEPQNADSLVELRAPWIKLRSLVQDFARLQNQLEKERDTEAKLQKQNEFAAKLLTALGYSWQPVMKSLGEAGDLPVLAEVAQGQNPALWVLGALNTGEDKDDPLNLSPHPKQWLHDHEPNVHLLSLRFEEVINKAIFGLDHPPRWILLLSDNQLLLIDRSKWHEKRLLRFDLSEIFGRREDSTLKAMAALLVKDHLTPAQGLSLMDSLDENAHKHAFAVSEDLKFALRECVELLGNEAMRYWREESKEKVYTDVMAAYLNRNDMPCQIKTPPADIKNRWLDWCGEHVSPKNCQFVIDTRDWESKSEVVGWEDVKDLDCAIIERTILDDTVPNGPVERVIQYVAPFDLCSREQDYQTVWQHFEQRFAANPSEVTTHGS